MTIETVCPVCKVNLCYHAYKVLLYLHSLLWYKSNRANRAIKVNRSGRVTRVD